VLRWAWFPAQLKTPVAAFALAKNSPALMPQGIALIFIHFFLYPGLMVLPSRG
jgi:hypothetical protein